MFNKLRNRFLVLNLVTITIMMLIAFASIYLITYNNVHNDINMEIHRISNLNKRTGMEPFGLGSPQPPIDGLRRGHQPSVSLFIIMDKKWNITDVSSIFDMDSTFYEEATQIVKAQSSNNGSFKLEGSHWSYMIFPWPQGHRIILLDTSSQQDILTKLVYTFLFVASVMFIIIFFISSFFANKAIAPVKEAFAKQKQFIADASHELKTPLSTINTNVDVLMSNGQDIISNQAKWLSYIKSETERMTKLTNELLYLTQVDYSESALISSRLDLSEAVEHVILTMEAVVFENDISLNYEIEPDLIAYGNVEQLKQVVMILMDNALKYTNSKGLVEIALKKHNNILSLTVSNTGEGISSEHLERVFDRFYRTDKSRARKHGGYGLGLAIAKAIIEQHKGKIYVKSVVNEKTAFYVELPAA